MTVCLIQCQFQPTETRLSSLISRDAIRDIGGRRSPNSYESNLAILTVSLYACGPQPASSPGVRVAKSYIRPLTRLAKPALHKAHQLTLIMSVWRAAEFTIRTLRRLGLLTHVCLIGGAACNQPVREQPRAQCKRIQYTRQDLARPLCYNRTLIS